MQLRLQAQSGLIFFYVAGSLPVGLLLLLVQGFLPLAPLYRFPLVPGGSVTAAVTLALLVLLAIRVAWIFIFD
jgi:hypothetical protein